MNPLLRLIFIIGALFIFSCTSKPKPSSRVAQHSVVLPGDFLDFLDEFHTDIDFQKSHIIWPLQGLPTMMDSSYVEGSYRWTQKDWVMHQEFDDLNDEFEQTYSMFSDDMVIEHILHINGSMGMERRFSRSTDSWNLIYYAGMNVIRK